MDHSPRIEAEDVDDDDDDSDEDNDDKPYKKDLEKAVYGTQPTHENQSPLPDGLNGVLEEMVKCVLVMEAWRPQDDMWLVDAEGNPIDANPDHIYKFTSMKQK